MRKPFGVVEIRGFVRSNATEKRLLPRANRVSLGVRKGESLSGRSPSLADMKKPNGFPVRNMWWR